MGHTAPVILFLCKKLLRNNNHLEIYIRANKIYMIFFVCVDSSLNFQNTYKIIFLYACRAYVCMVMRVFLYLSSYNRFIRNSFEVFFCLFVLIGASVFVSARIVRFQIKLIELIFNIFILHIYNVYVFIQPIWR